MHVQIWQASVSKPFLTTMPPRNWKMLEVCAEAKVHFGSNGALHHRISPPRKSFEDLFGRAKTLEMVELPDISPSQGH